MASVEFINVNKSFNDKDRVVKNFSLKIADGEFIIILGPSGCGKSTLLRLIAGLEKVSSGTIKIGSETVNEIPPSKRNIAMVFQNYALYPHMSVYDNLAFPLKYGLKIKDDRIRGKVIETSEILKLQDQLDKKPSMLSGGQKQRVALGRAIIRDPAVFLFDEPLSNLDADLRTQTRRELVKLHKRLGTTMIYVTHDQVEAMTMGERICVIKDGSLQQVDKPEIIYNSPANEFVGTFVGIPKMNIIRGVLKNVNNRESIEIFGRAFPIKPNWKGKLIGKNGNVKIGLRPEHIKWHFPKDLGNNEKVDIMGFSGKVSAMENMGHETIIYFQCKETALVLRSAEPINPEEIIKFYINPKDFHFFC